MGAMKQKKSEDQARRRVRAHAEAGKADWKQADPQVIRAAIVLVSSHGGALRFGYTSDGGAFAIGVYGDGAPYTEYVKPQEGITEFLEELCEAWKEE